MARETLNTAQRQVVQHFEGPLLVLAGPGSGKTRVVTQRIARLLRRDVPPERILAVTFTNKAAREMRTRVRKIVGKRANGLTVATFHSACTRILRTEIEALGYGRDFSIYAESDQRSLMRTILRDLRGTGATTSPQAVLAGVAANKIGHAPVDTTDGDDAARAFVASASERYAQELKARNAIDFDDILLLTRRLLAENETIRRRLQRRYRFVLVDEYQDTNAVQDDILRLIAGEHRNLCVVGDDDQSIYAWRGADVEHILSFPRRYPGAEVVRLEQNYRSRGHILTAASALIGHSSRRHGKKLFTRRELGSPVRVVELEDENREAEFIARDIASALRKPDADRYKVAAEYAVLFRTNEQMRPLEQALRQTNVPYRLLGGKSVFDRKEAKDVAAYLRLAANRADQEALMRVINTPARGLGAVAIEALRTTANATGTSLWQTIVSAAGNAASGDLPARTGAALERFVDAIETTTRAARKRSPTLVRDLLETIGYHDEIERLYKDGRAATARWTQALEMNDAWQAYLGEAKKPELTGFLDGLALGGRDDDRDTGSGVTLSTVHASKGLEFDRVYIAGLEDDIFPHTRSHDDGPSLEEERRVLFVAVTRAKNELTLTRAGARSRRGQNGTRLPSRYLEELAAGASTEIVDPNAPLPTDAVQERLDLLRASLGQAKPA